MVNEEPSWSKQFTGPEAGQELQWGSVGTAVGPHPNFPGLLLAPIWFAAEADDSTC